MDPKTSIGTVGSFHSMNIDQRPVCGAPGSCSIQHSCSSVIMSPVILFKIVKQATLDHPFRRGMFVFSGAWSKSLVIRGIMDEKKGGKH